MDERTMGADEIGDELRRLRVERELTQSAVAKAAGLCGPQAVCNVERAKPGSRLRGDAARRIAAVLGQEICETYYLVPVRRRGRGR